MFCGLAQRRWMNEHTRTDVHNSFLKNKGNKKKSNTLCNFRRQNMKKKVKLGLPEQTLHELLCTKWKAKKKKSNNTYAERMGTNTDSYTEKRKSQLQQKKKVQEQNKRDRFLFYHFFIAFIIVRQQTDKYSAISRKNKSTSEETRFKYNDWNISETT